LGTTVLYCSECCNKRRLRIMLCSHVTHRKAMFKLQSEVWPMLLTFSLIQTMMEIWKNQGGKMGLSPPRASYTLATLSVTLCIGPYRLNGGDIKEDIGHTRRCHDNAATSRFFRAIRSSCTLKQPTVYNLVPSSSSS